MDCVMGSPPPRNLMLSQYQSIQLTHVTKLIMAYCRTSLVKICYWEIARKCQGVVSGTE